MQRLRLMGLVQGDEPLPPRLLEACHEGRLIGGLRLSLRASPDEVVGWVAHAMGGLARGLKVLDVREGDPPVMEVQCADVHEHWPVRDVPALIDRLNELFPDDDDVRALVVLGEWEDMLQVWAVRNDALEVLLETSLLRDAWNRGALEDRFEAWADDEEEDEDDA